MDVTELLRRIHAGDDEAFRRVMPLVYNELKRLAAAHLRQQALGPPLEVTALVHELYLRMVGRSHPAYENRAHFYGIASHLMRQLLVDMARHQRAQKRGSGVEVHLAGVEDLATPRSDQVLEIHEALNRLAIEHPRKAKLVEMRFFGGMSAEDSAEALSLSVHVVRHELRYAQAWLHRELTT